MVWAAGRAWVSIFFLSAGRRSQSSQSGKCDIPTNCMRSPWDKINTTRLVQKIKQMCFFHARTHAASNLCSTSVCLFEKRICHAAALAFAWEPRELWWTDGWMDGLEGRSINYGAAGARGGRASSGTCIMHYSLARARAEDAVIDWSKMQQQLTWILTAISCSKNCSIMCAAVTRCECTRLSIKLYERIMTRTYGILISAGSTFPLNSHSRFSNASSNSF
jgi:hypothetical protein